MFTNVLMDVTQVVLRRSLRLAGHRLRSLRRDQKEVLSEVLREGLTVIPGYVTAEKADELRDEVERVFEEHSSVLWRDEAGSDTRAFGAERASAPIREFATDPLFLSFARSLLDDRVERTEFTLANRVVAVPGAAGSGQGWHRDAIYDRNAKAFLYLSDVDEHSGPFEYFPGSNRMRSIVRLVSLGIIRPGQGRITDEQAERIAEAIGPSRAVCGKRGTLILADTSIIHRGRPPTAGVRYALTNYTFARGDDDRERWMEKFEQYMIPA